MLYKLFWSTSIFNRPPCFAKKNVPSFLTWTKTNYVNGMIFFFFFLFNLKKKKKKHCLLHAKHCPINITHKYTHFSFWIKIMTCNHGFNSKIIYVLCVYVRNIDPFKKYAYLLLLDLLHDLVLSHYAIKTITLLNRCDKFE